LYGNKSHNLYTPTDEEEELNHADVPEETQGYIDWETYVSMSATVGE
jgi:hypothetical protein